jgi:hypothetical protein
MYNKTRGEVKNLFFDEDEHKNTDTSSPFSASPYTVTLGHCVGDKYSFFSESVMLHYHSKISVVRLYHTVSVVQSNR